jgi:hypothetical protein
MSFCYYRLTTDTIQKIDHADFVQFSITDRTNYEYIAQRSQLTVLFNA